MRQSTDEESDNGSRRTRELATRSRVDVTTEEVVNGNVPFTRELEPIAAVPPISVEMTVGKT